MNSINKPSDDSSTHVVSVIIPNYNHELYLPDRIESVLRQTFSSFEIIILDDCSQDGSRDVIVKYASIDSRIKYSFNEKNSGSVFKQWAKGLALAKGKYVWIAESDDFADVEFLATLVPLLEQDDTLSFAYTNSLIVDEKNVPIEEISEIKKRIFNSNHWHHDFIVDGHQELRQYLSLQCTVNNASAVLFRRKCIDASGGIDTKFRYAGDWMTYIKLSMHGRIAYKAKCLNNYREHSANASKESITDGSQLFERQRCFSFLHKSKILDTTSKERMMDQASNEYLRLMYLLIREIGRPLDLMKMISKLIRMNSTYYFNIQIRAAKKMNTFSKNK